MKTRRFLPVLAFCLVLLAGGTVRAANLVHNGSFELGVTKDSWAKLFEDDMISSENPHHGKRCLSVKEISNRGISSAFYRLAPGDYRVSFAYRAPAGSSLVFALQNSKHQDLFRATLAAKTEWQLFSRDFKVTAGDDYALFYFGNNWALDAVCLAPAADNLAGYAPPVPVEPAVRADVLANTFYSGQPVQLTVAAYNHGAAPAPVTLAYDVVDIAGRTVYQGEFSLPAVPAGGYQEKKETLANHPNGLFSLVFKAKESGYTGEAVYAVLPEVKGVGPLGMFTHSNNPELKYLNRVNVRWYHPLTDGIFRGYTITPNKGEYVWFDENVARINQYLPKAVGLLCHYIYEPAWYAQEQVVAPRREYFVGRGAYGAESSRLKDEVWSELVYNIVSHYRGKIDYWVIDDEFDSAVTAEEFGPVMKTAALAARKADPQAKVTCMPGTQNFFEELIDLGYGDYFDVIPCAERHWWGLRKTAWLVRKYNKGVISYAHLRGNTFYRTHEKIPFSTSRAAARGAYNQVARLVLAGHSETVAPYRTQFTDSVSMKSVFDRSMLDYDGTLKSNGIGFMMAGSLLAGARPVDELMLNGKGMLLMGFLDGEGRPSVLAYGANELKLNYPAGRVRLFDWLGNPVKGPADVGGGFALTLAEDPIYIKSTDPAGAAAFFKAVRAAYEAFEAPPAAFFGFTRVENGQGIVYTLNPDGTATDSAAVPLPPNRSLGYQPYRRARLWLLNAYPAPKNLALDGDLAEYDALPAGDGVFTIWGWPGGQVQSRSDDQVIEGGEFVSYNNNRDFKAYLNSCWDGERLAFAFRFNDEKVIPGRDGLEIHLWSDWPAGAFGKPVKLLVKAGEERGRLVKADGSEITIPARFKKTAAGYQVEVAAAPAALGLSAAAPGRVIGLDFYFDDCDSEDGKETTRYRWAAGSGGPGQLLFK
ncbi:MAG TPA: hypothetical protein PKN80_03040 [bacterium]|nr:hypothetical protein [bacterium]HNS48560.1 hypothetical protein [bacterium]